MQVPFDSLPDHARLLVYPADRTLSPAQAEAVMAHTQQFLQQWECHGAALHAGASLQQGRFLLIGLDEQLQTASGCSMDKMSGLLRNLEALTGAHFLDRSQVPFLDAEGQVFTLPITALKQAVAEGRISAETPTFHVSALTVGDFRKNWILAAADSWMRKYFALKQV